MSEEEDYLFALEMQKRLDAEMANNGSDDDINEVKDVSFKLSAPVSKYHSNQDEDYLNRTQNLVHPQWETLDPTPDILSMFTRFDAKFFRSRLKCVSLEWSKRMYSCAGICYQRRNRFGMDITIRLSEPLLKLRTRKDLVETMLHEMIHAYCFVLNIREGNGGHGPNFKKIMCAINKVAGTNITVYHTFHDEVNVYRQHWWRCNGICQEHSPFFGYVKRTSNRAPGPNDQWWEQHIRRCGGVFMKIKGPEKKSKPEKQTKSSTTLKTASGATDLRKYFTPTNTSSTSLPKHQGGERGMDKKDKLQGPTNVNGECTMLKNPKDKPLSKQQTKTSTTPASGIAAAFPPTSYPGLSTDPFNLSFGSSISKTKTVQDKFATLGGGRSLSNAMGNASMSGQSSSLNNGQVDRNHLRDVWSKRFDRINKSEANENEPKKRRISTDKCSDKSNTQEDIISLTKENSIEDDDIIIIAEDANPVIELLSDSDGEDEFGAPMSTQMRKSNLTTAERQEVIKQEIIDETEDLCNEDILLIDDDYDDNDVVASELADTSVIDEFFEEDKLLAEFECENDVVPTTSRYHKDPKNDIISCPVCFEKLQRRVLEEHLNGCMGIVIKVSPPKFILKGTRELVPRRKRPAKQTARQLLLKAGYTEKDLSNINDSSSATSINDTLNSSSNSTSSVSTMPIETERHRRQRNFYSSKVQCPCCGQEVEQNEITDHVDECSRGRVSN